MKNLAFTLILFLSILGCGPSVKMEKVVPASGVLLYQGKPLAGYRLTFEPTDNKQSATATTDNDGKFVLGTNKPGDGAAVGKHRVAINFISEVVEGEPGREVFKTIAPKHKLSKSYENAQTSGVEVDIPPSGNTSIEINLK